MICYGSNIFSRLLSIFPEFIATTVFIAFLSRQGFYPQSIATAPSPSRARELFAIMRLSSGGFSGTASRSGVSPE
jgi:hypothetical protein